MLFQLRNCEDIILKNSIPYALRVNEAGKAVSRKTELNSVTLMLAEVNG